MPRVYRRFAVSLSLVVACAASLPIPSLGGAGPSAVGEPRILAERILRHARGIVTFSDLLTRRGW